MIRTSLAAAALSLFVLLALAACTGDDLPGGACGSCSEVYTNGGITCGPGGPSDAWRALSDCACGAGICAGDCTASFCRSMPADMACGTCLLKSCAAQESSCAAN